MLSAYIKKILHIGIFALMAGLAATSQGAALDCEQMLSSVVQKKLDKSTVLTAQKQLLALEYDPAELDGLLGPKTRSALLRFCAGAQFALNNELLLMLQYHAEINKAYKDWVQTLASSDFIKWAATQSDQREIEQTRMSGNSIAVIALLDRYHKRKTIPIPAARAVDDFPVSYLLTKEDFNQLKSTDEFLKQIRNLQGKPYESRKEFDAAVEAALKGVTQPETRKKYMQLVSKYAEQNNSRKLTEESFNNLKVANVPDYILQPLQDLGNLNYPEPAFKVAVQAVIKQLTEQTMSFKPLIVQLAEISPSGAKLTDNSLSKFSEAQKDDPLSAPVQEALKQLQYVEYKSEAALSWAVKKVLMQVAAQIDNFLPVILANAEDTTVYSLSDESLEDIARQMQGFTVPEIYLEMLGDMQNLDYPDPELFWLALKAKIRMAGSNNTLRVAIFSELEKQMAVKVDAPLLEKLKAKNVPPAVLDQLGKLQGRAFDNTQALEKEVDKLFAKLSEQFEQYRPLIVAQAKKQHPFDNKKVIQWSGKSCNCVQSNLAGEVYGFYPYWMAGKEQAIDFSVQSRIGYYGLSFDDTGNIANGSWWSKLDTEFIREARTYGTKVDLVIYRSDWKTWNQGSVKDNFGKLAKNIVDLINIPLTDTFSKVKPYLTLGTSPPSIMGDGVTLYFDGYPQDAASVNAFGAFIQTLAEQLSAQGRKYSINIMFRSAAMGKGIYDYGNLIKLMDVIHSNKDKEGKLKGLFLVLLQEPTTDDKKLLRINIENGLHGKDRMKLLNNIAMVITYDGHNERQLADDVIYAKDDFAGIGFWPQTVAAVGSAAATAVSKELHEEYMYAGDGETSLNSRISKIICPNKWVFRIAWDIFFLTLLVSVVMRFVSCPWRSFFDKHFMHFIVGIVVPTFLLTLALLYYDPAWEQISRGNGILIVVIMGIIGYSIWRYQEQKQKADLP